LTITTPPFFATNLEASDDLRNAARAT